MADMLNALEALQGHGGLLVGFAWLIVEVRAQRRYMAAHRHDKNGEAYVNMRATDQ